MKAFWRQVFALDRQLWVCAVKGRRFPAGASPAPQPLQPEATGAGMEVTKCLKPSGIGMASDSSTNQAGALQFLGRSASRHQMARRRIRANPAKPASPNPIMAQVAGSGTGCPLKP